MIVKEDGLYVCSNCKKHFYTPYVGEWAYRHKKVQTRNTKQDDFIFCSWGCLQEFRSRKHVEEDWEDIPIEAEN